MDLKGKYPTMIYDLESPELIKEGKRWAKNLNLAECEDKVIVHKVLDYYFNSMFEECEAMYVGMGGIRFLAENKQNNRFDGGRYLEFTPGLQEMVDTICSTYGLWYEGGDDEDYQCSIPSEGFDFIYSNKALAKPTGRYFSFYDRDFID